MKNSLLLVALCLFLVGCGAANESSLLEDALNSQTPEEKPENRAQADREVPDEEAAVSVNTPVQPEETKPAVVTKPVSNPSNPGPAINPEGAAGPSEATVLFPNGRQIFETGKAYEIRWQATGFNYLNIAVHEHGRHRADIAERQLVSLGKYLWTPTEEILRDSSFIMLTVVISDADTGEILDESDAPFMVKVPDEE